MPKQHLEDPQLDLMIRQLVSGSCEGGSRRTSRASGVLRLGAIWSPPSQEAGPGCQDVVCSDASQELLTVPQSLDSGEGEKHATDNKMVREVPSSLRDLCNS